MSKVAILPLGLLERFIGQRVLIIMKSMKEFSGLLVGYDEFFHMVLNDVTERTMDAEYKTTTKELDSMLLNGNHIAMIVPGDKDEEEE